MSDDFHCDLTPISSLGKASSLSLSNSDDMSTSSSRILISPPVAISPNPAFIAASAASQIVTNDHENNVDSWFEQAGIEPSGETALVAPAALRLVNNFLDQLLYNFLATARSTSLSVLRPAVREVLRPKLAAEAIGGADEELHEYLGGGEDEELLAYHNGEEPPEEWDLEMVWKRTRLRCMVYSSLGDMEEEDEDLWTEKEALDAPYVSEDSYTKNGVVSPAVAIFLTSILEFMGERALIVAGGTAYQRLRMTYETPERDGSSSPSEIADRVVVDELDVERVGLDRTLGRLWRGWKKALRSTPTSPRQSSSARTSSHYTSRRTSLGNETPEEDDDDHDLLRLPNLEPIDHEFAASIPLPMSDNDVEEIRTPWLRLYPDDIPVRPINQRLSSVRSMKRRPMSLMIFPSADRGLPTPEKSEPNSPMYRSLIRSNSHTGYSPSTATFKETSIATDSKVPVPATMSDNLTGADHTAQSVQSEDDGLSATTTDRATNFENQPVDVEQFNATNPRKEAIDESIVKSHTSADVITSLGFVAGATAIASAAIAGVVALTSKGDSTPYDTDGEVPEIVTSSRVSLENSRLGLARNPSIRSISSHSLRVVDIPPRSRHNSIDTTDLLNRKASPILRAVTASPTMRHNTASPVNITRARSAAAYRQDKHEGSSIDSRDSISEEDEDDKEVHDIAPVEANGTPIPVPNRSPLRGSVTQFPTNSIDASLATPMSPTSMTYENLSAFNATTPGREYVNPRDPTSQTLQSPLRPGIPPLTPLREMMEGATDTSDEASSVTHSVEENKVPLHDNEPVENIAPLRTTAMENVGSKSPSSLRDDDQTPTPETFSKSLRQIPTAGSGTPQKMKAVRKSEDSSKSNGRSFEELMQSDKTIQYTLTPSSVRGIEKIPEAVPRKSPTHSPSTSIHTSSKRLTGLNSNPTGFTKSGSQPDVRAMQSRTPAVVQARDARVESAGNVGDFADFIRTTGPPNDVFPPESITPIAQSNGIQDYGAMNNQRRNVSAPMPSTTARVTRSASMARLQARDAVVPYGGNSSELIDFIRQGPPSTRDNPRIPRTVAPFRSTMDSEQMVGAISRIAEADVNDGRTSQVSTATSVQQSLHNSVSSQSALLNSYGQSARPIPANIPQNPFEDDMPKRKTRRVKDPYAIDYSDDEDGEINYIETDKPVRIEESLMDFLNAGPPGSVPQTSSVFDEPPRQLQSRTLLKKSSSASLMSRFSRKDSLSGPGQSQQRSPSVSKSAISPPYSKQPMISTNGYGTVPHTPPYNANYVSTIGAGRTSSPKQQRGQQTQFVPRAAAVPISKYRSDTDELADFLLNTAPSMAIGGSEQNGQSIAMKRQEAAMMQQQQQNERQRQASQVAQKSGGLSSIFSRRRKAAPPS